MKKICRFNQMGKCHFGNNCHFQHQERKRDDNTQTPCRYFSKSGNCRFGEKCRFLHSISNSAGLRLDSSDKELVEICSICFDKIDCNFALLSSCDHPFCYSCIKTWREHVSPLISREVKESCPLCRTHSEHAVPSREFLRGEDKLEYIDKNIARSNIDRVSSNTESIVNLPPYEEATPFQLSRLRSIFDSYRQFYDEVDIRHDAVDQRSLFEADDFVPLPSNPRPPYMSEYERDVQLIMEQAHCSREVAETAYQNNNNDLVNAIMEICLS